MVGVNRQASAPLSHLAVTIGNQTARVSVSMKMYENESSNQYKLASVLPTADPAVIVPAVVIPVVVVAVGLVVLLLVLRKRKKLQQNCGNNETEMKDKPQSITVTNSISEYTLLCLVQS